MISAIPMLAASALLAASPVDSTNRSGFELEWDPSVLLLQGFSAVAVYGPPSLPQWRFGVDVFTFQFPGFSLQPGWGTRAFGGSLLARFHPWGAPEGFWVAAMVRAGYWLYSFQGQGAQPVMDLAVSPRIGFNWFPFGPRFYVAPQIGLAIPVVQTGLPAVGVETHARLAPYPTPAIHVGWSF